MLKKIWLPMLTLTMLVLSLGKPIEAENPSDLEMTVDMPLQGIYKNNQLVQVYVHMKNSGDPFKGEISLSRMEIDQMYPVSYPKEVGLSKDEEKVVTLEVLSDSIAGDRQTVVTLKKDGKVVNWVPALQMELHQEWVVGVLAQDHHAFHFLSLIQGENQRNFFVKSFKTEDIPVDPFILDNLDILAIDDLPKGLTSEQIKGIKEWVANGGILLVSGGESYAKAIAAFGNWLPFTAELKRADISKELSDLSQMTSPVTQLTELKEAKKLFSSFNKGKGTILIASYDVTEEPLASWQGNKSLWQEVANQQLMAALMEKEAKTGMNYELRDVSLMSPGIHPPHFPTIASIWVIYILVVSPGLYILLKRRDKREWAWVIIPTLSIVLTAGIFFLGKNQVVKEDTSYTVSELEIIDQHLAKVNSATSFLVINGGKYEIDKAEGVRYIPQNTGNGRWENLLVKESGRLEFSDVPYLSMQQAYAKSIQEDAGSFDAKLYTENQKVKGTVKNNTAYNLKHVMVSIGLQEILIGDLAKGQEAKVDFEVKRVYMPIPQQPQMRKREPFNRQEILERMASTHYPETGKQEPVTISGVSEQGLDLFDVTGMEEKKYYSTIVRQNLSLSPTPEGKQVFPYGTLPLRLGETKGKWEPIENGYQLTNGFLNFALKVQPQGIQTGKIEVPLNESPYKPFAKKIYNVKFDRWDHIDREQAVLLEGEKMKEYMTGQGEIILRFENPTTQMYILPLPYFLVEGEAQTE